MNYDHVASLRQRRRAFSSRVDCKYYTALADEIHYAFPPSPRETGLNKINPYP